MPRDAPARLVACQDEGPVPHEVVASLDGLSRLREGDHAGELLQTSAHKRLMKGKSRPIRDYSKT